MAESGPRRLAIRATSRQAGDRVDRVLAEALPSLSRSRLKRLIETGHLTSTGAAITEPARKVRAGQDLLLLLPPAAPARPAAQAMDLTVVYEDASIVVVDKPAGLVVHPAPGNPDRTLVNALIAHCGDSLRGIGGERRPGIVHRLDKDTSGLLVAAKTEPAHAALVRQFAAREIERLYMAIVWGLPSPASGEFTGNIGRSPRNRKKMAVLRAGGREAVTRYRLERSLAGGAAALVGCRLLTGRTHQIRVHLADAGHPLIGDRLYGSRRARQAARLAPAAREAAAAFPRQALHAATLGFRHPDDGEAMRFESPLPAEMAALLQTLSDGP